MKSFPIVLLLLMPLMAFALDGYRAYDIHTRQPHPLNNPTRSWRICNINWEHVLSNGWTNTIKDIYYYNSAFPNSVDSIEIYTYDSDTSLWKINMTQVLLYDSTHEFLTHSLEYHFYNSTDRLIWVDQSFQYDDNNNLKEIKYEGIDQDWYQWQTLERIHYDYENNNISSIIAWYSGNEMGPASYGKRTFTFDEQGRITLISNQASQDSSSWVDSEKETIIYNPHDTSTGDTYINNLAHHIPTTSFLGNDVSYGMVANHTTQDWWGTEWVNSDNYQYIYDSSDRLIQYSWLCWSHNTESWSNNIRLIYSYDDNGNTDLVTFYSGPDSIWTPYSRVSYTWEQITDNNDNTAFAANNIAIKAFPNPFKTNIKLNVASKSNQPIKIELFNIKGQSVYKAECSPNSEINIESKELSSGVYIVKAKQGNQTATSKLLKLK